MDSQQLRDTIAAAQQGDTESFRTLLETYGPRLYGYFYRATRRHHDAEDLLSELTLRLVRTLDKYDHRGRFEPWLFRIAANMVRDRIRRFKTKPIPTSLSLENESGRALVDRLAADEPGVDAGLKASEASLRLNEALAKLDVVTRETILLRYFGQMSFKELAEIFDCPVGTVLARVHRGLHAMKELIDKYERHD